MRRTRVALTLVLAFAACSKQEDPGQTSLPVAENPPGKAEATAAAKVSLASPQIGGSMALVGDVSVELVLHRSGLVDAVLTGPGGAALRRDLELAVTATARGGGRQEIELAFSPARERFQGNAKAGVELASAPVDITLVIGGRKAQGRLDFAVALEPPRVGGHLAALQTYSAEILIHPDGTAYAFLRGSDGAFVNVGVELAASVATRAGASERLAFAFDPSRACYTASAKAGAELAPGPLALTLRAGGKTFSGGLARAAFSAAAVHGGQVVAVGEYSVELVAHGKAIQAFVFDASGKAVSSADLDLKLQVAAQAGTLLALKWDAPSASYRTRAEVDWTTQPLLVTLTAAGKSFAGGVASLKGAAAASAKLDGDLSAKASLDAKVSELDAKVAVSAPKAAVGAALNAGADAGAKARAAANVRLAAPKVSIQAPKVDLNANKGAGAKAGSGAKASAGFSFGTK